MVGGSRIDHPSCWWSCARSVVSSPAAQAAAGSSTPDSPTSAGTTPCAARAPGGASWTGNSPTAKRQGGHQPV